MKTLQLIRKAQQGDEEAFTKIFETFNYLILLSVKNFFIIGADREDILQEVKKGLLKAIKYYSFNKNTLFSTFATLCIRRHLITTIINFNSGKNKILNYAFSISFDKDGKYNKEYQFAGVTEN